MERTPVQSSHIKSFGYENGTLEVEFANGAVYVHENVPADDVAALQQSPSIGKAYHPLKSKYPGKRVS